MRFVANCIVGLVVVLAVSQMHAAEIDYLEDFALTKDRTAALQQLIPATEDYYYYHCLHYQNTEQFDKVNELLIAWINRYKDSPRIREIQNRQALLTYAKQPDKSLEFIRQRLAVQFNHHRERLDEKPNLPTALDQNAISRQTLLNRAFGLHQNLQGCEDESLDWLVGVQLNADRRRHLLERLQRPDYPQLVKLIVDDLNSPNSSGFGSFAIHGQLLLAQLDECLKLKPDLLDQQNFVNVYLTKLRPNADVDWRHDPAECRAYLERLWDFARRLAPVHNSLKAHVLYHRLALDRSAGIYDKPTFLVYLQLPRHAGYMNADYMRQEDNRRFAADLGANFETVTLLPPVGNDEPLVRSYLQQFFIKEATFKPYMPLVNDLYLKRIFAETKIVNGLGDGEQWYSMLTPADYQALKERIDLDFAETNKPRFTSEDPIAVDLLVKNVRTLIVKVYEINTDNFYRQNLAEVNTDINLDGLVANRETTYDYSEPPLRRVRRHFEFAELTKPGVYVIDFIGNGRSSRVVVRKGQLRHMVRTTTAGHAFTVLDERNRKLPQATLWFSGREYAPNAQGEIVVPFTNSPQRQAIVLQNGSFCALDYFQHQAEIYSLAAGIYVDREALLRRHQATVVVRPQLTVNGLPVTLSVLEDVQLVVRSIDQDGVATTMEVKNFKLFEDREATHEFQVPQRLSQIRFELKAKVQNLSQTKKDELAVQEAFTLNQIEQTEKIDGLHLVCAAGEYAIDMLGKTGEPKPDRPVRLILKHRDFRDPVHFTLQTDAQGRVRLGALDGIVSITATGPEDVPQTWPVSRDRIAYCQTLHGVEGEVLEVPCLRKAKQPARDEVSLLELRGDTFVADRFAALSLDGGLWRIAGLARGDYDLWLKPDNQRIRIRIAAGQHREGFVLGENRQLEVRSEHPLQIAEVQTAEKTLTVRLQNHSKFARVHVFATRYGPAYAAFDYLGRVRDAEPAWLESRKLDTLYVAGRNIGDEYRYILDRKYAKKFPGNMLERPSLLLNPWAVRSTETGEQQAQAGETFAAKSEAGAPLAAREHGGVASTAQAGDFVNLDFLAHGSAVLLNLTADEQGVVTIPRKELGSHQHLHIVAVDPRSTVYRSLSLSEAKPDMLDLRLADGLDPKLHFAQQKQISVVQSKQPFTIGDITSARIETYDSLARVYSLYVTLSNNANLVQFGFLMNWPNLKTEEKRAQYSKYACHELDFFLYHKDPEFFRNVVQPYLKNKKDPRFFDHWLLGHDLTGWLQPWNYEQLNVVERILLAQRLAADRQPTGRDIADRFTLIPADVERFQFLFETAIKGSALATGDRWGLDAARDRAIVSRFGSRLEEQNAVAAGKPPAAPAPASARPAADMPAEAEVVAKKNQDAEQAGWKLKRLRKAVPEGHRSLADAKGGADSYFKADAAERAEARQFYRKLDKTQEWAENNYYHLPIEQQNASLITVNAFWRDYAKFDPAADRQFRSINFAEASRNFSEMLLALAVLDLPFQAEKQETRFDGARLTLTPGSPLLVFHEEVKQVPLAKEQTPILVSQNFFRHGDRYIQVDNEQRDKFVTEEFLVQVVYGCQVVVTNPTSSPQKLDVLLQVPMGAIPVQKGRETRSVHVDLQPYHTQTLEYYFYFPAPGTFAHYPVQVAKLEQLVAQAAPFTFKAVEKLSRIDRGSWDYLSQFGTGDEVLKYLEQANLHRTNLEKIAFRMQDREFFRKATALLTQRHAYNHALWSYALRHNEPAAVREFLQHADGFVSQCGAYVDSPLLTIDPVARKAYQHLDYRPLVNARAHQLGPRRQIVNDRFNAQYHKLLKILSYRCELDNSELMSVTCYLLLQDRIEDAMATFSRVQAQRLDTRLQYDYFTAYLAFYREQPQQARALAEKYAAYPVDRWRDAFAAIGAQLDELSGQGAKVVDKENRGEVQTKLAATEASFDFQVEAKRVQLNFQNLKQVTVNYYLMDIELLFSRNPFVQQHTGQFQHIRPNLTQTVGLPAGQTKHAFELPKELHNSNVLVEIGGGGLVKSQAYYANTLALQVVENYGQIYAKHSETGQPLAKAYVKVYAQMQDGRVKFYKDGYTDLRGRFDYTSLSTNELDFVKKFSVLVLSEQNGAVVREADPPQR